MGKKNKKAAKKSNKIFLVLGLILTAVLVGYGIYAVTLYENSEDEQYGFFTCNKDKTTCEISQHIHADIQLNACGENITFPKEKGRTDTQHTHKEINKIHWHARVKVDPVTRQALDSSYLTIERFFSDINYVLPQTCLGKNTSKLSVEINGKEVEEKLKYVWKDADVISVVLE